IRFPPRPAPPEHAAIGAHHRAGWCRGGFHRCAAGVAKRLAGVARPGPPGWIHGHRGAGPARHQLQAEGDGPAVKLLLSPWFWLIAAVLLLATGSGGYWWGHRTAASSCAAKAGAAAAKAERAEDQRDEAIDGIGAATVAGRSAAEGETRSATHASVERIRTVVVPGDCRAVDPVVLRELDEGRERVNAKIRSGLRQRAAGADPAAAPD